jgi:hypothetical protein
MSIHTIAWFCGKKRTCLLDISVAASTVVVSTNEDEEVGRELAATTIGADERDLASAATIIAADGRSRLVGRSASASLLLIRDEFGGGGGGGG